MRKEWNGQACLAGLVEGGIGFLKLLPEMEGSGKKPRQVQARWGENSVTDPSGWVFGLEEL
jgi:hypothetical protein